MLSNNDQPTSSTEARKLAADEAAFERGVGAPIVRRTAAGYIHTTNPDGEEVVFVPGEALPDWALTALGRGQSTGYDTETGAWTVEAGPAKPSGIGKR